MEKLKVEWEAVKKLLPTTTSLVFINYNDNFDDQHVILQEALDRKCWSGITEEIDFHDAETGEIQEIKNQLHDDLIKEYNINEVEAQDIIVKYYDEIDTYCYDKDDSTPITDCLNNTSKLIAHYDTGFSMPGDSWNWDQKEIKHWRDNIKNHLGIKDSKHDEGLDMMICQASYGGQLLIYFELDFNEFMKFIDSAKTISFDNAVIGVVDHYGGSGDVYEGRIDGIKLPFISENLFLEKSIKYNWTYAIAGMQLNWAESTIVKLIHSNEDELPKINVSPQVDRQESEKDTMKHMQMENVALEIWI